MKAYGQSLALGLKATALVNDRKRHRCGLDQGDHRKLGEGEAFHSKGKTRAYQKGKARQVAKREILTELA